MCEWPHTTTHTWCTPYTYHTNKKGGNNKYIVAVLELSHFNSQQKVVVESLGRWSPSDPDYGLVRAKRILQETSGP